MEPDLRPRIEHWVQVAAICRRWKVAMLLLSHAGHLISVIVDACTVTQRENHATIPHRDSFLGWGRGWDDTLPCLDSVPTNKLKADFSSETRLGHQSDIHVTTCTLYLPCR